MHRRYRHTLITSAVLVALSAGNAHAQTLEEVVVTAQKREQSVTDVGIAVNAFTDEALRNFRVEDASDIAGLVSNMDIKGTLGGVNPAITLRGVGLNDFNANNNPSVGVYIDEVFLSSPAMLTTRMFDVERGGGLKGPQGTLWGRNATGGAISVVNKQPSQETDGFVTGSLGNFDQRELTGAIGGGLSDSVSGRFSLSYKGQGESFHDNLLTGTDFGDLDSLSLRGQLRFQPNDRFDGNLTVHYSEVEGANTPFTIFGLLDPENPINPDFSVNLCGPAMEFRFDNSQCSDAYGILPNDDGNPYTHEFNPEEAAKYTIDSENRGAVFRFTYDFDASTLTSITGYDSQDRVFGDNINSHPFQVSSITHDEEIRQFSQELRLSGSTDSGHNWIIGGFYSKDSFTSRNVFESRDLFVTNLFWDVDQDTTAYALFGSVDWALSDTLTLVTGLRYTKEEIDFFGGTTDLNPYDMSCIIDPFCQPTGFGAVPITRVDDTFKDDNVSGRLALEYRPHDDWMLYGSIATGFKSGGFFGDFTFDNSELAPFDSETITAYEIGSKSTHADGAVQVNVAVFYYDYKDIQTLVPGVLVTRFTNAEDAKIYGLDFDITAAPTEGLLLGLGIGLLDHELGAIGVVPAGNAMPNAADVQSNGFARYEFGVSDTLDMALQANFKYTDSMFRDAFNDPFNVSDSYTTVDARVALFTNDGRWELALWGKNIFDEEYTEQAFNFVDLTGLANQLYGAPRTYGLAFTYWWMQ